MIPEMIQTMRWYGPNDPVSLKDIRQAGAVGVVTALHQIPNGEVWPIDDIKERKSLIESEGLSWVVVESVPVHESIKTRSGDFKGHIENYKQTLLNLGQEGIKTVCYNFMPILDWTRTNLEWPLENGARALRYDSKAVEAFDLFILDRPEAKREYSEERIKELESYFNSLTQDEKDLITANILKGLPGSEIGYTLDEFREMLLTYSDINTDKLQSHLRLFLEEIVPIAEKAGIYLTIHPDDPPKSLYGLPRILSTAEDCRRVFGDNPSLNNGLCFCTGSFGVRADNNLVGMAKEFGEHINFIHLRSTKRDEEGNFYEANHLDGDVPMVEVIEAILQIQKKRGKSIPMRPDHGHQMLDDLGKKTNPGYSAIGRLKGLAEIRGIEKALIHHMQK
ncbi:mannonate dehydratase [Algoriphagus sediminis]|uniref:Mannonate dehydratase n=1 Tax=Algoriphagus sediminis TaxID=3057113 RepID=A0ABT7YB33_9BACT|nr:mannonate dehydratase [Algoriphagus sediminis]MDN3203735.1 mannonate dehydratase [Algoriphagus sediminis]